MWTSLIKQVKWSEALPFTTAITAQAAVCNKSIYSELTKLSVLLFVCTSICPIFDNFSINPVLSCVCKVVLVPLTDFRWYDSWKSLSHEAKNYQQWLCLLWGNKVLLGDYSHDVEWNKQRFNVDEYLDGCNSAVNSKMDVIVTEFISYLN